MNETVSPTEYEMINHAIDHYLYVKKNNEYDLKEITEIRKKDTESEKNKLIQRLKKYFNVNSVRMEGNNVKFITENYNEIESKLVKLDYEYHYNKVNNRYVINIHLPEGRVES